jgi:hypothetical protein
MKRCHKSALHSLDVVGDMSEVARSGATHLELSASSSSSEDSSGGGSSEDVETEVEKAMVVDPREAMISGSQPSLCAVSGNWRH